MKILFLLLYAAVFVFGTCLFALNCVVDSLTVQGKTLRTGHLPKLSAKYILFSCSGGVLAVLCGIFFGLSSETLTRFLFLSVLAGASLTDFDTMEIPNGFCIAAAAIGVLSCFTLPGISLLSRGIGVVCISVPMLLIALLIPGAFGGGDIKLIAACGVLLGWKSTLLAGFLGVLLGGAVGAVLLLSKRKKGNEHFAFGPCLCAGAAACAFWGQEAQRLFFSIFDLTRFL